MRHDNRERIARRVELLDRLGRGRNQDFVRIWKTRPCRKISTWVCDSDVPAQFFCESHERSRIVTGSENEQTRWRFYVVMENLRVSDGSRHHVTKMRAEHCGVRCLPHHRKLRCLVGADASRQHLRPNRLGWKLFKKNFDNPVAAQADAPNQIVLRGGIVGDEFGVCAAIPEQPRSCDQIFFQATPAD